MDTGIDMQKNLEPNKDIWGKISDLGNELELRIIREKENHPNLLFGVSFLVAIVYGFVSGTAVSAYLTTPQIFVTESWGLILIAILILFSIWIIHFVANKSRQYWMLTYVMYSIIIVLIISLVFVPLIYQQDRIWFNLIWTYQNNSGGAVIFCTPAQMNLFFGVDSQMDCAIQNHSINSTAKLEKIDFSLKFNNTKNEITMTNFSYDLKNDQENFSSNYTPRLAGKYILTPQITITTNESLVTLQYSTYLREVELLSQESQREKIFHNMGLVITGIVFVVVALSSALKNIKDLSLESQKGDDKKEDKNTYR